MTHLPHYRNVRELSRSKRFKDGDVLCFVEEENLPILQRKVYRVKRAYPVKSKGVLWKIEIDTERLDNVGKKPDPHWALYFDSSSHFRKLTTKEMAVISKLVASHEVGIL